MFIRFTFYTPWWALPEEDDDVKYSKDLQSIKARWPDGRYRERIRRSMAVSLILTPLMKNQEKEEETFHESGK